MVSAQEEIERTGYSLRLVEGRAILLFYVTVVIVTFGYIRYSLYRYYLWVATPEQYCDIHNDTPILNWICRKFVILQNRDIFLRKT
jgi:hypothetical protein